MIAFNLAEQIANAGDPREWKSGDRHAVSLIKDDSLNVLLMLLKKNALLHEHRTKGPPRGSGFIWLGSLQHRLARARACGRRARRT
jgi:hypothetical protein